MSDIKAAKKSMDKCTGFRAELDEPMMGGSSIKVLDLEICNDSHINLHMR